MNEIIRAVNYFLKNLERIWGYTVEHSILIIIAVCLAVIIWVATGILIRNSSKAAKAVLGLGSLIMAIPSLALYGILVTIPGLGLSRQSAVIGLVLYSMLPIVRNVYVALNEVDPAIIEAARGMGMSRKTILYKIQLPLAMPVILAGIRVATVMMVGIATLAVYIGERNLGVLIAQGLTRTRSDMIIVGAVIVACFAVVIDVVVGQLEKVLVPKGIRREKDSRTVGGEV